MKRYIRSARSSSEYVPNKRRTKQSSDSIPEFSNNTYDGVEYNSDQLEMIHKGLEEGVDVSAYADPKFSAWQMRVILRGLSSGVDVSWYADPEFNEWEMLEICKGLEEGLDVSVYADPKYDASQMCEIREGLEADIDVSLYTEYEGWKMNLIRHGLKKYADDPDIGTATAEQIFKAYTSNSPTLRYASMSKYERAKDSWASVKQAAQSRQPLDVPALEEEFNLVTLEGRAASTLGIAFDENEDGSITFTTNNGGDLGTISSSEFDMMVRSAIANSSTRSSFAKAFATQLKHTFNL